MKLSDILLLINDCQWVTVIDQFGNRLFRNFRRAIPNNSVPNANVIEIASCVNILIIEVRTCG